MKRSGEWVFEKLNTAYIAGVIDSDGSISIAIRHVKRPNPTYTAMIQISWKYSYLAKSFFSNLQRYYGGSVNHSKKKPNMFSDKETDIIKYCLTGNSCKKFLDDIIPFLILKSDQAQNVLELLKTTKFGVYGQGRPKPESLKRFHHKLYENNKKLNTKNGKEKYFTKKEITNENN